MNFDFVEFWHDKNEIRNKFLFYYFLFFLILKKKSKKK